MEDAEEAPLEQGNAVVEPSPEGGGTAEFRIKVGHVLFVFLLLKKKLFFFGGNKKKETKWKFFSVWNMGWGWAQVQRRVNLSQP